MSVARGPHERQQATIRRANLAACVEILRDHAATTVTEVARRTGLSRPTVESIIGELIDYGLVAEVGSTDPEGRGAGRPARQYAFRADAHLVASIDIGLHTTTAMVCDLAGTVRATLRRSVADGLDPVARARLVHPLVDDLLDLVGATRSRLYALVVCVPGIVDRQGRMVLSNPIPGWTGVNLAAWFGEGLTARVVVENDVNMATLAEHRLGAGRFADALMLVHVGHRMNAGFVLGGALHRGHNDSAGEIADVEETGWSALTGTASRAPTDPIPPDPGSILRAVAEGDTDARAALDVFARRVAFTIASVSAAIDPDLVVIGGGLSRAGETLVAPIREAVASLIHRRPAPGMVASQLGADGVALGGLVRALQVVSDRLYHAPDLPLPPIHPHDGGPVRPVTAAATRAHVERSPLRVAMVGLGARAGLAALVEGNPDARLVAVADPHPLTNPRAERWLGPDVRVVPGHRDLAGLGVDAAIVATPDDTHSRIAVDLLRAGVAVYLEKPIATSVADADLVLRTAHETGTRLAVGHTARHAAVVRILRQIIARGEIGEVKAVWCRRFIGNGGDHHFKDWRAERERSTGLLLHSGVQDIDVVHLLAGAPAQEVVAMGDLAVYGRVKNRRERSLELMPDWFSMDHWPPLAQRGLNPVIDVEDLSMLLLRTGDGVLASYQQCHFTPDDWCNFTVIGTRGRAENFGDGDGGVVRVWDTRSTYDPRGDHEYPIVGAAFGREEADALALAEFLRFVRDGGAVLTPPLAAREAVAVAVAATQSLRAGSRPTRVAPLPPDLADTDVGDQVVVPHDA